MATGELVVATRNSHQPLAETVVSRALSRYRGTGTTCNFRSTGPEVSVDFSDQSRCLLRCPYPESKGAPTGHRIKKRLWRVQNEPVFPFEPFRPADRYAVPQNHRSDHCPLD